MSTLTNIWNHPKTSVSGLLIAVVTIAGVLAQQGISLGHAGSGTVVTLAGALATALLGLLARDPGQPTPPLPSPTIPPYGIDGSTRLGIVALITLLLPLPFLGGCSATTVAQDIVNWTPALQSAVATVDTTVSLLAPADAPIFTAATAGFDAASTLLVAQAKAYLANPAAGTLAQIQTQIVTFEQQVDAALLQAAKIADPASQKHALAAIQAVETVVSAMLALVQSVSNKTAVALMASRSAIKRASIAQLLDTSMQAQVVAVHYKESIGAARFQITQSEQSLSRSGL